MSAVSPAGRETSFREYIHIPKSAHYAFYRITVTGNVNEEYVTMIQFFKLTFV